jgi:glyoxylase-like metal-dependent hydrolase (beta-lactamase superfamily II)
VRKILDAEGWNLQGILVTHSHADHIGGNHYLQQQYGCKVFANGIEAVLACDPILKPTMLYGSCPPPALHHRFFLAEVSVAVDLTDPAFPAEIRWFSLPGHSLNMVGYRTPDDVVFLGDALCSEATLDKYGITFVHDVAAYRQTLEQLTSMKAKVFVPCHVEPTEDIAPLARLNLAHVDAIGDLIVELCAEPITLDDLMQALFNKLQLRMDFGQYTLVGSTVRSYLSWLNRENRLEHLVEDNRMLWSAVK